MVDLGDAVLTDAANRAIYSSDNSIYQVEPAGVALPHNAGEVAELLRHNRRRETPLAIAARGGGTGTNGQSLTDGLVIDLKRNMNRLLSVDVAARTAVVEPGLVAGRLNAELKSEGLFWAPHTSTLNRATVGGMISTDAAGKGSLVHGRAHRHVRRVEMVLADGSVFAAEPTPIEQARELAHSPGRVGELWQALLDLPIPPGATAAEFGLPGLARGFSGYGIDRFRSGESSGETSGVIDPLALVVGAEGTLGVVTQATLALTPRPTHTVLVVAAFDTFGSALETSIELGGSNPTAIECFDETTLAAGRSSPAWSALGDLVGDHEGAVLLIEFAGTEPVDPSAVLGLLRREGRCRVMAEASDAAAQASIWKVRADAVGLLAKQVSGGSERSARPTAMVEDCAVPVESMAEFITAFRGVLDDHGLDYGMFGHADVGCVHVRPALDLTDPGHAELVKTITAEVVALLSSFGGILWGEHGRGFRGQSVHEFLPADTVKVMRAVKGAFDPDDLMNPGKLYRPPTSGEPLVAVDEPPFRGQVNRAVPVALRRRFDDAFACNGNGLCHHYDAAEVMCPSYKATGDPALSPQGRANLLRAVLAAEASDDPGAAALADQVATNLDQCLSCAACSGHCPVEVDVPELKSRFFEHYYSGRSRPVSHRVLSRFESLAAIAARAPRLARLALGPAGSALGLVDLPVPKKAPARQLPPFASGAVGVGDVVILPDVFTSILEPQTLHDAYHVLTRLGYPVTVAEFRPSGKFDHVKGERTRFTTAVQRQANLVREVVAAGAIPVVIEPAIGLLFDHEYPAIDPEFPTGAVRPVVELIEDRIDRLDSIDSAHFQAASSAAGGRPTPTGAPVTVLGHCTERATEPDWLTAWVRVLTAARFEVDAPDVGCCGMAGIFGHEAANQEMSKHLWELSWAEPVQAATGAVVATGFSCRSQANRFGQSLVHPLALLNN